METNYQKHLKKYKSLDKRLKEIEKKYPDFDFRNLSLRNDLEKYWKLERELIYESVDTDFCKSDNPDHMCSDCNCWKRARAMCS